MSTVSVVVPTRDRPRQLAACLDALAAQTTTASDVVIVDDRSRDPDRTRSIVDRYGARMVAGEGRGPAAARNAGIDAARGDVICFTDDDCVPAPDWITHLTERIAAGAAVAAGATEPFPYDAVATRASQLITNSLLAASLDRDREAVRFAPTCNLALSSATARAYPFDESFPLAAGEDREWCDRVTGDGVEIAYVPEATVAHRPDLTVRAFWRQQVRYGRGAAHWRRRTEGPQWQASGFYLDLLGAGFRGGVRCGVLVIAAQLATAYGLLAETLRSPPIRERAAARRPSWTDRLP